MQSSANVPVFIPSNVQAFLTVKVHDLVFADRLLCNSVYIKFLFKVRDDTKCFNFFILAAFVFQ